MKTYDTTEDFIFIVYKNNKFSRYELGIVLDDRINFLDVRNIPSKSLETCWYRDDFIDTSKTLRKLLEKV